MFFIMVLFFYFAASFYAAWRIVSGLQIPPQFKIYIYLAAAILSIGSALIIFLRRFESLPLSSLLSPAAYIYMGILAITFTALITNDIINITNLVLKIPSFRYYSTLITLIIVVVVCLWSFINVAFILKTKEIKIPVENLPVENLKIALLSDIHITPYTSPKTINKIWDKVLAQKPDIIVLAGDITDSDINTNDKFLKYGFDRLRAPAGIYIITGNHEYYSGLEEFFEMFKKLNIKVLKNESIVAGGKVNIAGIEDTSFRKSEDITLALSNVDKKLPIVFLSHRPESFDIAANLGHKVIQLSGHTHAGQIPPIDIIRALMKYNYGLYYDNGSVMYVTSGTRFWGPPMRFSSRSEIVIINLVRNGQETGL